MKGKVLEEPRTSRGRALMKRLRILIIGDFLPDIGGITVCTQP